MIVIGLILGVFGIGFFCWLLFTLAVYALPFFAGLTAGLAAFHGGAGMLGALAVGAVAGIATLIAGQLAFAATRSIIIRFAVCAVVCDPGGDRRLSRDARPCRNRRAVTRLARSICGYRRDSRRRHGVGTDDAVRIPDAHGSPFAAESGQAIAGSRGFGGLSLQPASLTKRSSVGGDRIVERDRWRPRQQPQRAAVGAGSDLRWLQAAGIPAPTGRADTTFSTPGFLLLRPAGRSSCAGARDVRQLFSRGCVRSRGHAASHGLIWPENGCASIA